VRRAGTVLAAACLLVAAASIAAGTEQRLTDRNINDAVQDELLFDQAVPSQRIDIMTKDGIVTLSGRVDNLLAKERAAALAETVKGVRAVVNRVKVMPSPPRSDISIQTDVKSALLADPATDSYEIDVAADDGVVALKGEVDSFQEKRLAGKVAKGVRGVRDLSNDVSIRYSRKRGDTEIKPEIEQVLRWDSLVDDALIQVRVSGGKVTLSGTVGSAVEKSRAVGDAWVAGVREIDAKDLEVARWARDEDLRRTKYVVKSDEEIGDAVEDALLHDPRVLSFHVMAEVDGGVATLRGTVDNLKSKRAAFQDARNTVGVLRVRNRIKVRPGEALSDSEIAENVRDAVSRDPYVEKHEVSVEVYDGVAHLYGIVDSYFEKGQADDAASRAKGVIDVRNHLGVDFSDRPLTYEPYVDDYYPYIYDWYDYEPDHAFLKDVRIRNQIKNEIWWSPFVDSSDVYVAVKDGVATLTGTVDSFVEMDAAVENAYEGGASWVDNDLEVRR
jgi:osmotically-inducible protein OsmY